MDSGADLADDDGAGGLEDDVAGECQFVCTPCEGGS